MILPVQIAIQWAGLSGPALSSFKNGVSVMPTLFISSKSAHKAGQQFVKKNNGATYTVVVARRHNPDRSVDIGYLVKVKGV